MTAEIDIAGADALIDRARATLRTVAAADPTAFGGTNNPRLAATLAADAPRGTIGVPPGVETASTAGLMAAVDLTLLDKNASPEAVETIAARAKQEGSATVCVYPEQVPLVQRITGGNPPPIAVVGFPSVPDARSAVEATVQETHAAILSGAKEIDMVLPLDFKNGTPDYAAQYDYLRQVVVEAGQHQVPVKVILETAYLTDAQKVEACLLAKLAGATFVKTSTGFAQEEWMQPGAEKGATPHDVALMRRTVGDTTLTDDGQEIPMGVKASGGVRTRAQAMAVYEAGASRIGGSSIDMRTELEKQQDRRDSTGVARARGAY